MTPIAEKYHRIFAREAVERLARAEAALEAAEGASPQDVLSRAALEFHAVKGAALTLSLRDWGAAALSAEGLARTAQSAPVDAQARALPQLLAISRKLREEISAAQVMRE